MENIFLTIHLLLAVFLVIIILLQRSEGGGIGLGTSNTGLISGRSAASALTRLTWFVCTAFIITSISLTIVSARKSSNESIIRDYSEPAGETEIILPDVDDILTDVEESKIPAAD